MRRDEPLFPDSETDRVLRRLGELEGTLRYAYEFHCNRDLMNAAAHTMPVVLSPLTERLGEAPAAIEIVRDFITGHFMTRSTPDDEIVSAEIVDE